MRPYAPPIFRPKTVLALALLALCGMLAIGLFSGSIAYALNTTVVVKPSTLVTSPATPGWLFYNDQTDTVDNTLGTFVTGPGVPISGVGSAQISVTGAQRRNLATYQFSGTPLANITTLRYTTYNPSAGNGGAANRSAYLNFNADFTGADTWQRRLVWVPSVNGAVTQNAWKEWDTINGGNGLWLYSGANWPIPGTGAACSVSCTPGTTPKTWATILSDYPGVRIRVTDAHMGLRVGEPYADGYTENIDSFKFGTASGTTTYNFEPETLCTTTCYVNAATGNDSFGGDSPTSAKKTIQAAVTQVSPGGVVIVAAGSYTENVTINQPLTLNGPQAGNPVGSRTFGGVGEAKVAGVTLASTAVFTINASNVTIDGFSITNTVATGAAMGITITGLGNDAVITNDILDTISTPDTGVNGTAQGIYLTTGGPDRVHITRNRFNEIQSERSAKAILMGDNGGTNPSVDTLIQANTITDISSTSRGAYGLSVASVTGVSGLRVLDNTINNLVGGGWAHAIGLEGDTPGAVIEGNVISGLTDLTPSPINDAIAVWFESNPSFASVQVHRNSLAVGAAAFGLAVHPALIGGPVSATCNWWGSVNGPTNAGNPPGTGSISFGSVTFGPWLASSNINSYCAGPVVTFLSPASGPTTGGTRVWIHGNGFYAVTQVTVDGAPVAFTVRNSTAISITTPAHAGGLVNIVVTAQTLPSAPGQFTYVKKAQRITFGSRFHVRPLLQSPAPMLATASSGLPVTLTSMTPSVCTTVGDNAILHTVGTCTIVATQAGNGTYDPAPSMTKSFIVRP